MKISSTITVHPGTDGDKLFTLLERKKDNRAEVIYAKQDNNILITINTEDVAAFRSNINVVGQQLALFETTGDV